MTTHVRLRHRPVLELNHARLVAESVLRQKGVSPTAWRTAAAESL